jgi:hypothetical protein
MAAAVLSSAMLRALASTPVLARAELVALEALAEPGAAVEAVAAPVATPTFSLIR